MSPRLLRYALHALPSLVVVALTLLRLTPGLSEASGRIGPILPLPAIYLWSVFSPRELPIVVVAAAGLAVDVATGLPLGLSAVMYVAFMLFVRSQRKYILREGFVAMWGYFALMTLAMQALFWLTYSLYYGALAPVGALWWQWVLTALIYPLAHALLHPFIEKLAVWRYRLAHAQG